MRTWRGGAESTPPPACQLRKLESPNFYGSQSGQGSLSCKILVTLGQYLDSRINSNKQSYILCKSVYLRFLCIEEKLLQLGTICKKKQSIALEILYRSVYIRIDLGSTAQATEVTKCQGLFLCLDISADNFRTSTDTGQLFTSLRFFRKGILSYVYIDLQRSPSNLTLCQCKVDLRSMSTTSKLCQVVYHSTLLDETQVVKLLFGYSGSKSNYHKQNKCSA